MTAIRFSDAQQAFIPKQGAAGGPVADICRKAGFSQASYFTWKTKYEGMLPPDMRRLKQLEFVRALPAGQATRQLRSTGQHARH
jgi:putative transposase